jgi:hypothetical protein
MSFSKTRWIAWPAALVCMALAVIAPMALAQVAPSAAEVARYSGLHAAAHRGELPQAATSCWPVVPRSTRATRMAARRCM